MDEQYRARYLDKPGLKAYVLPGDPDHTVYVLRDKDDYDRGRQQRRHILDRDLSPGLRSLATEHCRDHSLSPVAWSETSRPQSRGKGRGIEALPAQKVRDRGRPETKKLDPRWWGQARSPERSRSGSPIDLPERSLDIALRKLRANNEDLGASLSARFDLGRSEAYLQKPHAHKQDRSQSRSRSSSRQITGLRKHQTIITLWGPFTSIELVKASSSYTEIKIPNLPLANIDKDAVPLTTIHAAHPMPRRYLRNLGIEELRVVGEYVSEYVFGMRDASEKRDNLLETLERVNELLRVEGELSVGCGRGPREVEARVDGA